MATLSLLHVAAAAALATATTVAATIASIDTGAAIVAALVTSRGTSTRGAKGRAAGCTARGMERHLGGDSALVGKTELLEYELLTSGGKICSRCELAMLLVVSAKRGLRPRRRLRTGSESLMTRPTSESASAVAFIS